MSIRAIVLGLLVGLFISGYTHFNDLVIKQTLFLHSYLPIGLFGVVVLLLLLNPLLGAIRRQWVLQPAELGVITAIALASCGWPSFGFYRYFVPITAMPAHWHRTETHWHANYVMSYVPGGSAELGAGHVRDWPALTALLLDAGEADGPPTPLARFWEQLEPADQQRLARAAAASHLDGDQVNQLLRGINRALARPNFYDVRVFEAVDLPPPAERLLAEREQRVLAAHEVLRLNRWLLVAVAEGTVLPPPAGAELLLAGGRSEASALDDVLMPREQREQWALLSVPWETWRPTILLWGGLGLVLAFGSLCLMLVLHPQWSKRELLSYPIARFVNEIIDREPGSALPRVAGQSAFWMAFVGIFALHGVNGLHAYFPAVPPITTQLNLQPLLELFPHAAQVRHVGTLFGGYLFFSAIAFCFFLTTPVAFSLGISQFVFVAFAAVLIANGVRTESTYIADGEENLLRFGAYLGMALMIAYIGRHYYVHVLRGMVGLRHELHTPGYTVWAARGATLAFVLAVLILRSAGLDWLLATLCLLLIVLMFVVLTRVVAETGMFFLQAYWMPVGVLTGLLGIEAIGPTGYIVLALVSLMILADPRTELMPFLANALKISETSRGGSPGRLAPWLVVMLVLGFFVAGAATFAITHDRGMDMSETFDVRSVPMMAFNELARHNADMLAYGTIDEATQVQGLDRLGAVRFSASAYGWMLLGMTLVLGAAAARLYLPWWPIHPVLFIVWSTGGASRFGVSLMIGWLIKLMVVRLAGARGYRAATPVMVGVIGGEVFAALFWIGVGAIYYATTRTTPPSVRIFP